MVMRLIVSTDALKWATAMNNAHKYMLMLLQFQLLVGGEMTNRKAYGNALTLEI